MIQQVLFPSKLWPEFPEPNRNSAFFVYDHDLDSWLSRFPFQDVFMMIRRKKTTIFTDAKDTTTVLELKKMVEGILKVPPKDQRLYNKDNTLMDDDKQLSEYGITMVTAKAQQPAVLGLAVRVEHDFEQLEMCPYSQPPDLPEVMKNQDGANGEQA